MKIKIHPLFLLMMIACAIFGGLPDILICLTTALLHECGHIFYAAKRGFACSEIKIMPYGAAAVCDVDGMRARDELCLALAGPFVNACVCVLLAGLWWFVPESYAYTDSVMKSNLAMLAINLLPAYPLDGGKALKCALCKFLSERASVVVLKVIAAVCAAMLIVAFVFSGYNISLATLALFLCVSVFEKPVKAKLINFSSNGTLKRGVEVKYMLCDENLTFLQAFKMLEEKRYLVLRLVSDEGVEREMSQDELYSAAVCHSIYDKVFGGSSLPNGSENSSSSILPTATLSTQSVPKDTASSINPEREAKS